MDHRACDSLRAIIGGCQERGACPRLGDYPTAFAPNRLHAWPAQTEIQPHQVEHGMVFGLKKGGVCKSPSMRSCSMSARWAKSRAWIVHAHSHTPGHLNRRLAHSPGDALIDIAVRCRLRRQIPIRLDFDTLASLRITALPQRRATRRCDVRWLGLH